jgi:ribosome-binding factor A
VKDARIGMVTITDVEASPDLKVAKVYIQTVGDEGRQVQALKGLASAAGFIRSRLGRELRIRRAPELHFAIDRTLERAARIEELLHRIRDDDGADGGGNGV